MLYLYPGTSTTRSAGETSLLLLVLVSRLSMMNEGINESTMYV